MGWLILLRLDGSHKACEDHITITILLGSSSKSKISAPFPLCTKRTVIFLILGGRGGGRV